MTHTQQPRTIAYGGLSRVLSWLTLWLIVLTVGGGVSWAQTTPETMPQRGLVPIGAYAVSDLETINVVTGNLMYRIPLATLPAGHGGWTAGVSLIYNSQIYDLSLEPGTSEVQSGQSVLYQRLQPSEWGGWRYAYMYGLILDTRPMPSTGYDCNGTEDNWKIYRLRLMSPDGGFHTLHLYPNTPSSPSGATFLDDFGDGYYGVLPSGTAMACPQNRNAVGDLTYYTTDGSYMKLIFRGTSGGAWTDRPWTLYLGDGRTAGGHGAQMEYMSDANGNWITVSNTLSNVFPYYPTSTVLADTIGHSITIQYNRDTNGVPASDTITQAGYSEAGSPRTLTSTVNWTYIALTGSTLQYPCSPAGDMCPASSLGSRGASSVTLPATQDGTVPTYTFGYAGTAANGWGELNDVVTPAGAHLHYSYADDNHFKASLPRVLENPVAQKTLSWTDEADGAARTESTTYSFDNASSQITGPDGGITVNEFYDPHAPSNPRAGTVFRTRHPDGSTVERTWYLNRPLGSQGIDTANPYVKYEFTSVASGGAPTQAAVTTYSVDKNGNRVGVSEANWIPYTSITRDSYQAPTGYSGSPSILRATTSTFNVTNAIAGNGSEGISDATTAYWNPTAATIWKLLGSVTVGGVQSQYLYWDSFGHPNLTTERHWDDQTSSWLTTTYDYDSHGNRTVVTDPRGYQTKQSYDSSACMYQRISAYGTPRARTFTYVCEAKLGRTTSETDADHSLVRAYDYDRFGRRVMVTESGGGISRKTATQYLDGSRKVTVMHDRNTTGDAALSRSTWYDQLGRIRQTTDEAGATVQRRYYTPAGGGASYEVQSNPYVSTGDATMGWRRTKRDTNGRVLENARFAGAALPAPWGSNSSSSGAATTSYSSNTITNTDEAGVARTIAVDGAGRMTQVTESGVTPATSYGYDVLDNVTTVTQGTQARSFTFSTVGRLTSAVNPESGTTGYTYDANGNIQTRAQAGSTTTYAYDELDQLTGKTYSDSTPVVSYGYDHGWRTSALSGSTLTAYTLFDGLGRIKAVEQTTNGVIYKTQYSYNLADGVTSMTLPSGRSVTTTFNSAGRPATVQGTLNAQSSSYVSGVTYASHGAPKTIAFGNGITETTDYNSRLQPTSIAAGSLMTLSYAYTPAGSTNNNGNVRSHTVSTGGKSYVQTFTYDALNRLSTAAETSSNATTWSQGYGYDRYGNRWVSAEAPSGLSTAFTPVASSNFDGNNRMIKNSATYDSGGRQSAIGGYGFGYDAENRLTWSTMNSATTSFSYDADGRRVAKSAPSGNSTYVYGLSGELVAEYSTMANQMSGIVYLTADLIGSTRLVTNGSGAIVGCHDYLPFGEEVAQTLGARPSCYSATDSITSKFTGHDRDQETLLDYLGARYLSGAQGRFTTPDAVLADQMPADPQSWNLYSYVRNNPLRFTDPTGRACVSNGGGGWVDDNSGGQSCADVINDNKKLQPSVTVTLSQDELNLMMLGSVGDRLSSTREWAEVTRNGMEGAMAVDGIRALPVAIESLFSAVRGGVRLLELWKLTRLVPASLEELASGGGPTIELVTSQERALDATRRLSTATGDGAVELAKQFRPGGTLYTAKVPTALLRALQSRGFASTVTHPGGATEYLFEPEGAQYVIKFFK